MLKDLKKKIYLQRLGALFDKAKQAGKITTFEPEIFDKMSGTIIACLPVSLQIKHSNVTFARGTCYDRSLYMFLALDDAVLVRGNNKDLEYRFGKNHAGHGWVEIGDYVYDPSLMLKFDKDVYYTIYGCSDVRKIDKKTYEQEHIDFIKKHVSTDINEFKPNGKRRLELGILIYQLKAISKILGNEEFTKDLDAYLEEIEYDEEEIRKERERALEEIFKNQKTMEKLSDKKCK